MRENKTPKGKTNTWYDQLTMFNVLLCKKNYHNFYRPLYLTSLIKSYLYLGSSVGI